MFPCLIYVILSKGLEMGFAFFGKLKLKEKIKNGGILNQKRKMEMAVF